VAHLRRGFMRLRWGFEGVGRGGHAAEA